MKIRPTGEYVVLELELQRTTKSGIIKTALDAAQRVLTGRVVVAGPGRTENGAIVPMSVVAGDRILFDKFLVSMIEVANETIFIGKDSDIIGVLEDA